MTMPTAPAVPEAPTALRRVRTNGGLEMNLPRNNGERIGQPREAGSCELRAARLHRPTGSEETANGRLSEPLVATWFSWFSAYHATGFFLCDLFE